MPKIARRLLLILLAAAWPAIATASETAKPPSGEKHQYRAEKKHRKYDPKIFKLRPFIIPMFDEGEFEKQFILQFFLKLNDGSDRSDIRGILPKMRNDIYTLLFRLISFRRREPRIPRNEVLRGHLYAVAQRIAGDVVIDEILIEITHVGKPPDR